MLKIILLIIYIATILAVIFIERKNPTEAMLWVLVMVCIPYLGVLLYLVFGSTTAIKLTSVVRRKRLSKRLPAANAPQDLLTGQNFSDEDLQVMQFNANYNNSPVTRYDDYKLFINGESHYRALFADIKEAKESIYVLFYTIHHDVMGEALVEALTKKSKGRRYSHGNVRLYSQSVHTAKDVPTSYRRRRKGSACKTVSYPLPQPPQNRYDRPQNRIYRRHEYRQTVCKSCRKEKPMA